MSCSFVFQPRWWVCSAQPPHFLTVRANESMADGNRWLAEQGVDASLRGGRPACAFSTWTLRRLAPHRRAVRTRVEGGGSLAAVADAGASPPPHRKTAVFWDVDNVRLPKLRKETTYGRGVQTALAVDRFRRVGATLGDVEPWGEQLLFRAYGNESTIKATICQETLEDCGVGVVEVETLKEAADWMLITDVTQFAREFGEHGSAVIISSDQGFAQVLRYASGCGCRTVVMNNFEKSWRKTQGVRDMRTDTLGCAADIALVWSFSRSFEVTSQERELCSRLDFAEQCQVPEQAPGGIIGGRFKSLTDASLFGFDKVQEMKDHKCFLGYHLAPR